MRIRRLLIFCLVIILCFPLLAGAQGGSADIARRTLESGIAFYRSGDFRQALQDFQTVINSFPDSEWVDEALLYIARYRYEVEGDLEGARGELQRVVREHAQTNSTPRAYYYLGYILFDSRLSVEHVRDGLANLERVVRLFPESEVAADALLLASRVHIFLGEYDGALEKLQKIIMEFPNSPLCAEAQFLMGDAFMSMDDMLQAMVEFQQVRNGFPDSPLAERALDRLTLLYRLHFSREAGIEQYRHDFSFSLHASQRLDDPIYLVAGGDGGFFLADRGLNQVLEFDPSGRQVASETVRRAEMVKVGPWGGRFILANRQLWRGGPVVAVIGSGESAQRLTSVRAFCIGPRGDLYLWDDRVNQIHRFANDLSYGGIFRSDTYRDVRDMAADSLGNVYVLEGRDRRIKVYDPAGRPLRTVGPRIGGFELRDPRYIAIDEADNLYVLDRRQNSVVVVDASGQELALLAYGEAVRDPRGLVVDASGAVIVVDRRQLNAVRFH